MEDENIDPANSRALNRLIYTNSSNLIMLKAGHFQSVFGNKVSRGGFERKKYEERKCYKFRAKIKFQIVI
jgi:poly(3-hydroxyalkanoate) synthetase